MPFKSKKQWKWAFAMHKKFAQKWAKETPNYKSLPSDKHTPAAGVPERADPACDGGYRVWPPDRHEDARYIALTHEATGRTMATCGSVVKTVQSSGRRIEEGIMRVLLDEDETAKFLGTTPKTLRTWRYRRVGPPWIKVVAGVRYDLRALERWLDLNTVTPQGAA